MGEDGLTREEELLKQIATLQAQLAQVSERWAYCEAHGSMAAKVLRESEATMARLRLSLAIRGLEIDSEGHLVTRGPKESA